MTSKSLRRYAIDLAMGIPASAAGVLMFDFAVDRGVSTWKSALVAIVAWAFVLTVLFVAEKLYAERKGGRA
jgi:hypothetical protein